MFLNSVKDLFFPLKCPGCGEKLDRKSAPLCPGCRSEYERMKTVPCKKCGIASNRCQCPPKAASSKVFCFISVFPYDKNSPGGRLILLLKDRKNRAAVELLGGDMTTALQNGVILEENAVICHVPRNVRTYLEKGTDQARELAREVAARCALPLAEALAHRTVSGSQKELGASERRAHACISYEISKHCPELSGRQVILVDDVLTTGSTFEACASLLKEKGATKVVCLAAARTRL